MLTYSIIGFDSEVEPKEEECIRMQLESHLSKKHLPEIEVREHKTKCSENYFDIEEENLTPSPMKVEKEGMINSLQKYNSS